jgi:hypothetical protein
MAVGRECNRHPLIAAAHRASADQLLPLLETLGRRELLKTNRLICLPGFGHHALRFTGRVGVQSNQGKKHAAGNRNAGQRKQSTANRLRRGAAVTRPCCMDRRGAVQVR